MNVSRAWMIRTLESLGIKHSEAEVYLYLLQSEPQKSKTIAEALEIDENKLYRFLKSLQVKGLVKTSPSRPMRFSAIEFEKVLDQLIKADKEEAQQTEENKEQILKLWRSKIIGQTTVKSDGANYA